MGARLVTATPPEDKCEPSGHCDSPGDNFMTGGGVLRTPRHETTHGFELHCKESVKPNNLQVNRDQGNHFHLTTLTKATCTDDPTINPHPPRAGFDTFVGEGIGRLNGVDGAKIKFKFTDAGEPGTDDFMRVLITKGGNTVLSTSGTLDGGNHQAHNR